MPGKKYELAIRISRFAVRIAARYALLDVAAMAQVVADHELRGLRAGALRAPRRGKQRHVALLELHELVDRPHALHRAHDRDRAAGPRRGRAKSTRGGFWPRRVHVVDDVDAADERDPAVDVAELAVQPPQPVRAELPRRDLGTVLEQRDAAADQHALRATRVR